MKSVKLVSDEESLQVRRENRQQAAANVQESDNVLEVENVLELKNVQEMEESSDKVENYPTTETAFKLRVGNLGKFVTKKNIAKFLEANKVIYKSIKSAPKWDFCMLSFESTAELDLAMETLTGREYKSNIVSLQKMAQKQERRPTTVSENVSDKPPGEQIQDQVTPLWRLGYTEQIAEKTERIEKQLQGLTKQLFKFIPKRKPDVEFDHLPTLTELHEMNPEFRGEFQLKWLKAGRKENSGKPCFLNEMVPSPVIEGYRNKCEFTFGLDLDGNRTLGFLLGNFKNGINTVINSNICLNVSPSAKSIVNVLEKCCKDSKYNVYDKVAQIGFWRSALVRTALNGDSMILVQVHPSNLSSVDLDTELNRIKDYVVHECSCLTPVYDGVFNGINDKAESKLVYGEPNITEKLLGTDFLISPTSFFQVNSAGAEVLYSQIRDMCRRNLDNIEPAIEAPTHEAPGVILLDICCGTGTIGITLAKHVKKVIGVEMISEAVEDAKINAKQNGVENIEFHCAKVEDIIGKIFRGISTADKVVAILDPPRSGLHHSVIHALRSCEQLEHIIYVACDFGQSMQNIVE